MYEVIKKERRKCLCSKGSIDIEYLRYHGKRVHRRMLLACVECSEKYHIERFRDVSGGKNEEHFALVPEGETMHTQLKNHDNLGSSIERMLCYRFSFGELKEIDSNLEKITSCANIKDTNVKKALQLCRDVCGTGRIPILRQSVKDALRIYHELEISFDSERKRLTELEKRIIIIQ